MIFLCRLNNIQHPLIKQVRGKGLWMVLSFIQVMYLLKIYVRTYKELSKETHQTVIRFAPPLMITKEQIMWAMEQIRAVFKDIT